jgi:hypothetical protein
MQVPRPDFAHLRRMSDGRGTFEHARFTTPRPEHGYCTDDMARVLVVATRAPGAADLAELSLGFLEQALGPDGAVRNRLTRRGAWKDLPALEDAWGRTLWGLGFAAAHSDVDSVRQRAAALFGVAACRRSVHSRAMAFAAIGAAEMLAVDPDHGPARSLLVDVAAALVGQAGDDPWPWPEARLRYANAVLPEARIAVGVALERPDLVQQGLDLLDWLLAHETVGSHLSVTPVGGAGPGDPRPGFDQQPIEVAALADACARAALCDDRARWPDGVEAAAAWFLGANDAGAVMWDPLSGGGFDGLEPTGVNRNQGTESTLALLSTLQHARRLARALR